MEGLDERLNRIMTGLDLGVLDEFKIMNKQDQPKPKGIITKQLTQNNPAYILALSDVHLGSLLCNKEKFQKTVNFIESHRDVYTILLGDLAETATRSSVGLGIFEEEFHIDKQLDMLVNILSPLANKGKILGILPGNHEYRIHSMTGIDPTKVLADRLGVDYCGYQGYFNLMVGEEAYTLVAWHGAGGAATKASRIKAAEKLKEVVVADVYISGHTHDRSYHDDFIDIIENGQIKRHHRHYVVCGSYLEYVNSYAEMKGLTPTGTGGVIIRLSNEGKDVTVTY
jgi:UDP-2,3-diacylglucosamine pyrophosphatase LpxH